MLGIAGLSGLLYIFFKFVASDDEDEEGDEPIKEKVSAPSASQGSSDSTNRPDADATAPKPTRFRLPSIPLSLGASPLTAVAALVGQWPPLSSWGKGKESESNITDDKESSSAEPAKSSSEVQHKTLELPLVTQEVSFITLHVEVSEGDLICFRGPALLWVGCTQTESLRALMLVFKKQE